MRINDLTTEQLITTFSDIVSLLKERKVIRTKNLIGDLKELAEMFHRNTGAINSRIKKLELKEKYGK